MGVIEAVIGHMINPWTEILEPEPFEGSAEPPLEEGADVPIPEPTIIEHPGGEKTNFFWMLRAHQCALPVIVLMLMYYMLKRRSKVMIDNQKSTHKLFIGACRWQEDRRSHRRSTCEKRGAHG